MSHIVDACIFIYLSFKIFLYNFNFLVIFLELLKIIYLYYYDYYDTKNTFPFNILKYLLISFFKL